MNEGSFFGWRVALMCTALGLGACGQKADAPSADAPPASKEAGKAAATAETAPTDTKPAEERAAKSAEEAAPAKSAEVVQCERIVAKQWLVAKQALLDLSVENIDELAPRHASASKNFVERCATRDAEVRDCIEKAEDPIAAVDICGANKDLKPNERLYPATVLRSAKLLEPQARDAAEAEAMLKRYAGKWLNDWESARLKTTWTIAEDGNVAVETLNQKGEKKEEQFTWTFPLQDRARVTRGTSSQEYVFVPGDERTFYAGGNLSYGAYRVTDKKNFMVRNSGDHLQVKDGECMVFGETGTRVKPTVCEWAQQDKKPVFQLEYGFEGQLDLLGKPMIKRATYHHIGEYLLDDRLVNSGRFVKQK